MGEDRDGADVRPSLLDTVQDLGFKAFNPKQDAGFRETHQRELDSLLER